MCERLIRPCYLLYLAAACVFFLLAPVLPAEPAERSAGPAGETNAQAPPNLLDLESRDLALLGAALVVLLLVAGRAFLWRSKKRSAQEDGDTDSDPFARALFLLSRKLDEKSFAFLIKQQEELAARTRKLIESKLMALESCQKGDRDALEKELARLAKQVGVVRDVAQTSAEQLRSIAEGQSGNGESTATERELKTLARSLQDLTAVLNRRQEGLEHAIDSRLAKIDKDLDDAHRRLRKEEEKRVRNRVKDEVACLQIEWNAHIHTLKEELLEMRTSAGQLAAERDASREIERGIRAELAEARQREESLRQRSEEEIAGRDSALREVGEARRREEELRARLEAAGRDRESLERELGASRSEGAALRQELETARANFEETRRLLRQDLETANAELEETRRSLRQDLETANAELEETRRSLRQDLEAANAELEETRRSLRQDLEAANAELEETRQSLAVAEASRECLEGELRELKEEREGLREDLKSHGAARRETEEELECLRVELRAKERRIQEMRCEAEEERSSLGTELEAAHQQLKALEAEALSERRTIPELKKKVESLTRQVRVSRHLQRALTNGNLPVATFAFDASFKVFIWNPAAEALWGRPRSETLGRRLSEIDLGCAELVEKITNDANRVMLTLTAIRTPASTYVMNGGSQARLRLSYEPIRGANEKALGVVVSVEQLAARRTPAPVESPARK